MYKNCIFDFYGTIADVKFEKDDAVIWNKLCQFMAYQNAQCDPDTLKAAFEKAEKKQRSRYSEEDYPSVDILDVFTKLYMDRGVKAKPRLIKDTAYLYRSLQIKSIGLNDGIKESLTALKNDGKRLYLLVNGQEEFVKAEIGLLGLEGLFEGIYVSSDFHMSKPSPKFLKKLLKDQELNEKKTLVIGTQYVEDIKCANKVGVDSLFMLTDATDKKAKAEKATYSIMEADFDKMVEIINAGAE